MADLMAHSSAGTDVVAMPYTGKVSLRIGQHFTLILTVDEARTVIAQLAEGVREVAERQTSLRFNAQKIE
ncbi:hypothetical protein ACBG85_16990 [Rhodococcus sp. NyZ502]|uniref:hypothetical protein n=1 Tax=Rhodococcus sp. NyZ502 TaxID=3242855 RepID=UPI00355720B9